MSQTHEVDALLAGVTIESIDEPRLVARDNDATARLRSLPVEGPREILLLNGTRHHQLFPTIVDLFAMLQRVKPSIRVTSASYFDDTHTFGRGVADRGIRVIPIDEITGAKPEDLDRYDVILAIGPSMALVRLLAMPGLRPRLVGLDLGFYHQLIEASGSHFYNVAPIVDYGPGAHRNRMLWYSCQPGEKVRPDLARAGFEVDRFDWRPLPYIPIGFRYGRYLRASRHLFDIALLGSSHRDYDELQASTLAGRRTVFLGSPDGVAGLDRLRREADVTVFSRLDDERYARLLSVCRTVVLPAPAWTKNVFLSVVDAMATGKALVTSYHLGIERLADANAPIAFYRGSSYGAPPDRPHSLVWPQPGERSFTLAERVDQVLGDDAFREDLGQRAMQFAREQLDLYQALEAIVREQLA